MRFTVTALGGSRRSLPATVASIVDYLQPDQSLPSAAPVSASGDTVAYYGEGGARPGRWLGHGAAVSGLAGTVDADDFTSVLSGRDPRSGQRLVTAQGSAGRRAALGVGAPTVTTADGRHLYGPSDAAAVLGLTAAEVERLLDLGQVERTGPGGPGDEQLEVAEVREGVPLVDGQELARFAEARADGVTAEEVLGSGPPDEDLSLPVAARLAGVTPSYLRRAACRYETDHVAIDEAVAEGRKVRRAWLVARRTPRGSWRVTRGDLAAYLDRRRPPAVRVGFDVTLTTEKSLGVLALLADADTSRAVLDAIRTGNDRGLAFLEEHAAVRVRGVPVPADGFTIASYEHLTSRALDPFPHHHNVLANTATGPDGVRRALDARCLYRHAVGASRPWPPPRCATR